jgi:hypothetical protein
VKEEEDPAVAAGGILSNRSSRSACVYAVFLIFTHVGASGS